MTFRLKAILLSGAALSLLGTSAMAADIAPPVNDWTGFYFGVGGGGAFSFSETDASGYGYADLYSEDYGGSTYSEFEFDQFGNGWLGCSEDCDFVMAGASSMGGGSIGSAAAAMLQDIVGGEGNVDPGSAGDNDTGKANAFGTVEGGFDYQVGSNFLIGVNAAFNFGSVSIKNDGSSAGYSEIDVYGEGGSRGYTNSSLETDLELGNSWSVGARAGYLVSDSILLFASGGYVSTKAELKASYALDGGADVGSCCWGGEGYAEVAASSSNDDWLNGYYLGGGVETLLTDAVSFKMEYRFSDLGSIKTSAKNSWEGDADCCDGEGYGRAGAGVSAEANPIVHAIRATINWRF